MQQYFADSFSHYIFCIYVVETYFSEENALALKNGQTEKLGAGDEKKFLPKDLPKDTHQNKVSEKTCLELLIPCL